MDPLLDLELSGFLVDLCEQAGFELLIRNRKKEVFNYNAPSSSLPYTDTVVLNSHKLTISSSQEKAVKMVKYLLSEKAESETSRQELVRKEKLVYSLQKVSEGMCTIYDLNAILQLILDVAREVTDADTGAILLISDEGFLDVKVASGKDRDLVDNLRLPIGEGITGWAAQNAQLVNVPDVTKDKRFYQPIEQVRSELAVPLMSEDDVIGVLNVDSKQENAFSRDDEIMLKNLAVQAAKIIENSSLYKKASRKVVELSILFQINKAVNTILDLDTLLCKIVSIIRQLLNGETVILYLVDQKGNLNVRTRAPAEPEKENALLSKVNLEVAQESANTSRSILLNNFSNYTELCEILPEDSKLSMLSAPVILHGETIGVINISRTDGHEFDIEDKDLMETIAIQLASAISNARLYEKTRDKVRELALINSLGNKFNSSLDIDRVLNIFIQETQKIFNSDRTSLMLIEEESKRLSIKKSYGLSEKEEILTLKPGEGIAGSVMESGNPVLIRNTKISRKYKQFFDENLEYSLICSPLTFKGRILGVINLERDLTRKQSFDEENLDLLSTIAQQGASAIENAHLYSELVELYLTTIQSLAAAIDAKDPYTHGHSKRVAEYAVAMAEKIGCSPSELEVIRHTALLHDIGKIGIPEKILLKPGKLTQEEFQEIRRHPVLGTEIIKSIKFLDKVSDYLKHHHEKYDGTGYPDGLKGDEIPIGSRIIAIADAFDAMTSDRPYRKSCPPKIAIKEVEKCAGTQFDPWLVQAFSDIILDPCLLNKTKPEKLAG